MRIRCSDDKKNILLFWGCMEGSMDVSICIEDVYKEEMIKY